MQPLAVLQPRLDTSSIPGVQPDLYQAMATTALQKMRTLTSDYCIGTGGYGSVCRAQLPSGKIFALKDFCLKETPPFKQRYQLLTEVSRIRQNY